MSTRMKQRRDQRVNRKWFSPFDGPQQSGASLIVEGDDDAGGWKVGVVVDGRTPAETQRWLLYLFMRVVCLCSRPQMATMKK